MTLIDDFFLEMSSAERAAYLARQRAPRHPLQQPSRGGESQRTPQGGSSGAAGDGRTSSTEGR